jgi:hypothetical protein
VTTHAVNSWLFSLPSLAFSVVKKLHLKKTELVG